LFKFKKCEGTHPFSLKGGHGRSIPGQYFWALGEGKCYLDV
jgi:hypothetical protein